MNLIIKISEEAYKSLQKDGVDRLCAEHILNAVANGKPLNELLDEIRAEIEQLPIKTRTNWDGCCPDIDYPEIEYVDVTKATLLEIIDKHKTESEENE